MILFPALLWRSMAESQLPYDMYAFRYDCISDARDLFRVCKCESLDLPYWRKGLCLIVSNPRERSLATRRVKSLGLFQGLVRRRLLDITDR